MANNKIQTKLFDLYKESKLSAEENSIVKQHLDYFQNNSQLSVFNSLKESLKDFSYRKPVALILERLQEEINQDVIFYELENIFKMLEAHNQGMVYRPVMQVILDTMFETNVGARHKKIMNELKLHDWVKPIAEFLYRYTQNPLDKQNITSRGGKAQPVYTFVESVTDGQIVYIKNKWFMIKEDSIFPVVVSDYVKDIERLRKLNLIQTCMEVTKFDDEMMSFYINEDLTIGVSSKTGEIFLNGDKAEKSSTLESIFNSPQVPVLKRDFFLIIKECISSKSQFKNLDIALHVSNIVHPGVETFAIKHKDKCYAYIIDNFSGNTFFQYEAVSTLIREVDTVLGFDLTEFFKEEVGKETELVKKVQDTQKIIYQQLDEVNENLDKLEESNLLESNEPIRKAHDMLKGERTALLDKLKRLGDKVTSDKVIINSEMDLHVADEIPSEMSSTDMQTESVTEPQQELETINESLKTENIVCKYNFFDKEFVIYGVKESENDDYYYTYQLCLENRILNKDFTLYRVPTETDVKTFAIETGIL